MANLSVKDAAGSTKYIKATGAGTDGDPHILDRTTTLAAGTAAIGKLAANSGVDIGDVDVLSLPSLPAGTNAIGKLAANSGVDIGDVDVTSLPAITGTVTANLSATDNAVLDAAVATLGATNGAKVVTDADGTLQQYMRGMVTMMADTTASNVAVASIAAGTNAIGKLAANSGVDIGDVDVTSIAAGTNTIGATRDAGPSQTITRTYTTSADMTTAAAITAAPNRRSEDRRHRHSHIVSRGNGRGYRNGNLRKHPGHGLPSRQWHRTGQLAWLSQR